MSIATAAILLAIFVLVALGLGLVAGGFATARIAARVEKAFPPRGQMIDLPGGAIHLRERGPQDAPPHRTVVLIHGAMGNLEDLWTAFEPRLDASWRVVGVDRPGSGWSDRIAGQAAATQTVQARLIAMALAQAGVGPALVVGHSLGGATATTLALDGPEQVAGLLLLCPATHPWPGGIDLHYRLASLPILGWLFSRAVVAPLGMARLEASLAATFHPFPVPDGYVERTALPLLFRPAVFAAHGQDVAALKPHVTARAPSYGRITVPVAIVSGARDETVWPAIHTEGLRQQLPDATVTLIPDARHQPHHTHPSAVLEALHALSRRVEERSAALTR